MPAMPRSQPDGRILIPVTGFHAPFRTVCVAAVAAGDCFGLPCGRDGH